MANTGFKGYATLEQYYTDDNSATGLTKPNSPTDADYVAPEWDPTSCPIINNSILISSSNMTFVNFAYDMTNYIESNYDELNFSGYDFWVSVSPAGASNNFYLDVFVEENTTGYNRYCTIYIYHGTTYVTNITVEQYA